MQATVLILGARGRFGLAAARAFADAGWRVLGQMRPGAQAGADQRIEWLATDLRDTQALATAARGATVVVHALNPAYTNAAWRDQVAPMMDAAIAVTRALDATLQGLRMVRRQIARPGTRLGAVAEFRAPDQAGGQGGTDRERGGHKQPLLKRSYRSGGAHRHGSLTRLPTCRQFTREHGAGPRVPTNHGPALCDCH